MQDNSGDDEFFDALGDEAQIGAYKAKACVQPVPDGMASRITYEKNFDTNSARQFSHGIVRIRTFKPLNIEENENTLAISERVVKDCNDTTAKSLQQILAKLDETAVNVSAEAPGSSNTKSRHRAETKETELESSGASQPKFNAVRQIKGSASNSPPPETLNVPSVGDEMNNEQLSSIEGENMARSTEVVRHPIKNPLRFSAAQPAKKTFFSLLNRKRMAETEFSREHVKQNNKSTSNFDKLICLQMIDDDRKGVVDMTQSISKKTKNSSVASAATWIVKFSPNNRLLATGGNDGALRIFQLSIMMDEDVYNQNLDEEDLQQIVDPNYISLIGHKSDIIDISWYKDSNLVLTSAVDKLVILWNVQMKSLVKVFEHSDIVPCIAFHPVVDEFFATGCFDKMIRIWDINETKVVDWVQTSDLITALAFSPDKTLLLVGFFKGIIKMYRIDQGKLKFTMEITCKNAFSWGKLNRVGKKVTAIVFTEDYEFLVMTNDSRMRLINLKSFETKVKYKGHLSGKYHIQPSYNIEKELILSGSEDEKVYVWNKMNDYTPQLNPLHPTGKSNRNTSYEHFKPFSKANTTCAVWVPFPVLKRYKEKMLSVWKDIYVDSLMIVFSSDAKIKILGNLIELENGHSKKV